MEILRRAWLELWGYCGRHRILKSLHLGGRVMGYRECPHCFEEQMSNYRIQMTSAKWSGWWKSAGF